MSMILYSPFSCIYHIPFGNLVGHRWVEIASIDQGESCFTAESILLMQKQCTRHLVRIIFIPYLRMSDLNMKNTEQNIGSPTVYILPPYSFYTFRQEQS